MLRTRDFLTLLTLFLSLLILSVTADDDDAYTACSCVRDRLNNRPCSSFVRHAVPRCAPTASRHACENLCCQSCFIHGDHWPVCRSASLRRICDKHTNSHPSDTHIIGPKTPKPSKPEKPDKEPKSSKEKEQPELLPSPEEALFSSEPYYPYYTPELLPTPVEGEQIPQPTPMDDDPEVTPMYYPDYPDVTPEAPEKLDPPFDATNEGELDLAPARGRPFAPAACECMSRGIACNATLAAASGVCHPLIHAMQQTPDCHFACCRICIVNMFATYCDDAPIVQACGL